jgi:hypothetical protein
VKQLTERRRQTIPVIKLHTESKLSGAITLLFQKGYFCKEFGEPECINRVSVKNVTDAIEKVLSNEVLVDETIAKS